MRKLASIQQIKEIKPIEGADRIEKIRINDWWCVSERGNFNVGDLAVYFEIDALLPSSNPIFSFLAKGNSEKTVYQKKEISTSVILLCISKSTHFCPPRILYLVFLRKEILRKRWQLTVKNTKDID